MVPKAEPMVAQSFSSQSFSEELNNTLIVLISKIAQPETIHCFRPFSPCNVIYKLGLFHVALSSISKVALFRVAIPAIISRLLIHTMRKSRSKSGYMAFKIDLEKADKVR